MAYLNGFTIHTNTHTHTHITLRNYDTLAKCWRDPYDEVAEWLRRWTANPLGSARVGSNPIFVELFSYYFIKIKVVVPGVHNQQ